LQKCDLVVVVDENGNCSGISTKMIFTENLLDKFILSDKIESDTIIVGGDVYLSEIGIDFSKYTEMEDDTVSSFVIRLFNKIPENCEFIIVGPYKIEVLSSSSKYINKVCIQKNSKQQKYILGIFCVRILLEGVMASLNSKKINSSKKMHVFLLSKYEAVYVKPGYFYNYLFPRGLAVVMSGKISDWATALKSKESERKLKIDELIERLQGRPVYFSRQLTNNNKFKIGTIDVVEELKNQYNCSDVNQIKFPTITKYGVFPVNFHIGYAKHVSMFIVVSSSMEHAKALGDKCGEIKKK
jgi:ribosomal protein L9